MGPKSVFRTFFALTTPEYGLMKAGKSLVGEANSGKIRLEKNDCLGLFFLRKYHQIRIKWKDISPFYKISSGFVKMTDVLMFTMDFEEPSDKFLGITTNFKIVPFLINSS